MRIKRLLLVMMIIILFSMCFIHMNKNFDRLSRYPYEDKYARELIDIHLNNDEIEYIIEYSIAPQEFIKYISEERFNIYHLDFYRKINDTVWYLDDAMVVDFTERVLDKDKFDEALELINHDYYYTESLFWIENGDIYNPDAKIILNPNAIDAYLDENYTISKRVPFLLLKQEVFNQVDEDIVVRDIIIDPLMQIYSDLNNDFSKTVLNNLLITKGYISYDKQVELYNDAKTDIKPGHSEHQLGLALDFIYQGSEYYQTRIYNWLIDNAYNYGFIIKEVDGGLHVRYVGYELANDIYMNNTSLKEVLGK